MANAGAIYLDITSPDADRLIGASVDVLVDRPGEARGHREAPEIDGVVHIGHDLTVGEFANVEIVDALGPDLVASGADVRAVEAVD